MFSSQAPAGSARTDTRSTRGRQAGDQRSYQPRLAGEVTAHETGRLAVAAKARVRDFAAQQRRQAVADVGQFRAEAVADHMSVAVRQHDEVAGGERCGLAADAHVAAPLDDEGEFDDVVGRFGDVAAEHGRWRRAHAPRRGAVGVEEHRAGEFYRAQEFGKRVHGEAV